MPSQLFQQNEWPVQEMRMIFHLEEYNRVFETPQPALHLCQNSTMHHDDIAALYVAEHSWLQAWLRRRLGDHEKAAELAQDVFVRLLSRVITQPIEANRPYLASIARGLLLDHWRRQALEQAWLETLATAPLQYAPSPEEQYLVMEALHELDRMLASLKPRVRQAFLLAQLDGMSCPQIAAELQVSVATAERYIATALRACYAVQFET